MAKDNIGWDKKHKKIMVRGQGDSWRPQSLEALHECPMVHKDCRI